MLLVLYLFGEMPIWGGLTPYQIIVKVAINDEVPDYSKLPSNIQSICKMCMIQKEERSNITDVLRALLYTPVHLAITLSFPHSQT